jgi:hypothetical protein
MPLTVTAPVTGSDYSRPYESSIVPKLSLGGSTAWTKATYTIYDQAGTAKATGTLNNPGTGTATFPAVDISDPATWPDDTYSLVASASIDPCDAPAQTVTFTLSTGGCSLQIASSPAPAWTSTNGNNAFKTMTFSVSNTCDAAAITFNSFKFTWPIAPATNGVASSVFVSSIAYGATTFRTGLTAATGANGSTISFGSGNSVTVAALGTSSSFTVTFSSNFTTNAGQNGTQGKVTSIVAGTTSPTNSDELVFSSTPIP